MYELVFSNYSKVQEDLDFVSRGFKTMIFFLNILHYHKQLFLIAFTPLCFPDSTIQMKMSSCPQLSGLIQQEICQHNGAFFPPVIQRESKLNVETYFVTY